MARTAAAVALLLLSSAALGQGRAEPRGDGNLVTQARAVSDFDAVRLEGPLHALVKVGGPASASVTIDGNLQPEVLVRVEDRTLVVSVRHDLSSRRVARVEIGAPRLAALSLHGSGDAQVEGASGGDVKLSVQGSGGVRWAGVAAGALEVEIEGSGATDLEGTAEELRLSLDGSGTVQARGLVARNVRVRVRGSGEVDLSLGGGSLDAEVDGSGAVRWSGEARIGRAEVLGSGRITRR